MYQQAGMTSNTNNKGKSVSAFNLHHAKVASRRYPRKKPVACIRPDIASAGGSFPRKDFSEMDRRCGRCALLLPWCLTPLLWSFAGQLQAVVVGA